ncbi:Plasmodium exported protein (hyp11), unknown function [Plasmodium sp. gorilla clade G2]|uniref:Plasmodium exported protein (hyp11), unknown function n=1 Tax=Plasmodium sp. gorilla clade G2 TaxID=880535 RepID=UPI000D2CA87A|nr:Plasmodium exported protein (hyp11), unknown function [Plasmodium sp. gorilla clade G2]SOV20085.1 Plasmodium exported protein (hyp11), unknown function [Plasmodium sp. gorilla clade G2]
MLTLILKILVVSLLIWKLSNSNNTRQLSSFSAIEKNVLSYDMLIIRNERILAEQHDEDAWRNDFTVVLNVQNIPEEKQLGEQQEPEYINELNELCKKASEYWKNIINDMEEEYKELTKYLDENWSKDMWNREWVKYLRRVYGHILADINDPSLTLVDKEHIVNIWLTWTKKDFRFFLEYTKETWEDQEEMYN